MERQEKEKRKAWGVDSEVYSFLEKMSRTGFCRERLNFSQHRSRGLLFG